MGGKKSGAVEAIRQDLAAHRRRRAGAVLAYAGLIAVGLVGLATAPGPIDVERDVIWLGALLLLFVGSTAATALAVGIPLLRRAPLYLASAASAFAMLGGLGLAAMPNVAGGQAGMKCFAFGSVISVVAVVILGVLSGRYWRRFPSPAFLLAVGVTGVGLAVLHLRCPSTEAGHLFGFHLTPVVLLFALTTLIVRARESLLTSSQ